MGCTIKKRGSKPITEEQRVRIDAILSYWYGDMNEDRNELKPKQMEVWFGFSDQIDNEIKQRFLQDYLNYVADEYSGWQYDKDGRLAAVILLDQFARQMFRKEAKAFATDEVAL